MMKHLLRALALCACSGLIACAPTNPVIDLQGETYDGMVPVHDSGMKEAWVKPDIDISSYGKILLLPTEVQFRAVRPGAGSSLSRSTVREFPIRPADQQRLVEMVTEVFREELAKSRTLTLTTEPGPDVLLVRISLLDIVSKVPPEGSGRTEIYLDEVGAATLVLELQDSTSGETLARAVDRRAAESFDGLDGPGRPIPTTSVTAWSEVRRVARRWASAITRRIDQLHTRGRMPG
ncbi:MAG: DUF3313 family protein [Gammaproteobacteria bacterium]|nr:DUF3313 family protein [Gammaproteobacteria bacterium]